MASAPLFRDILQEAPDGEAFWLQTSDGKRIRVAIFPGGNRGSVLLFPGRTEFIEKFDEVIARLVRMGFWVLVHDWRGQGLSDRPFGSTDLGHVLNYSEYQLDVEALTRCEAFKRLPRPHLLFSHSMGGLLALRALVEGLDIKASVFSSPMWGFDISLWMRPLAYVMTQAARAFGFGRVYSPGGDRQFYPLRQGFEGNLLTRDRERFENYCHQLRTHPELGLGGASLRWMRESMDEMARLRHAAPPDLPVMIFMSQNEGIVSNAMIRQYANALPRSRLHVLEGAQHEGWLELPQTRQEMWSETEAFLAENGL